MSKQLIRKQQTVKILPYKLTSCQCAFKLWSLISVLFKVFHMFDVIQKLTSPIWISSKVIKK